MIITILILILLAVCWPEMMGALISLAFWAAIIGVVVFAILAVTA